MKKLFLILAAAVALSSCATTAKHEPSLSAQDALTAGGTIFERAYDGVPSSYKEFLGRGGGYFVKGPEEALGPDAEDGWKTKCLAGLKDGDDYAYIIKYLENGKAGAIEYIDIYKPNGDLPLSRYIGKKKKAVLADFPLGAGDTDYGWELQYDAADMTVQVFLKGKTVTGIRVKPKKAADIGKTANQIAADWWGSQSNSEASAAYYFVVSRSGAQVSATDCGQTLKGDDWKNRKDPSVALAEFFVSYFSQGEEWHDLIAHYSFPGSSFDEGIATMNEAWEAFYGKVDSVRVTINPAKFTSNGDGSALYTVNIAYSYQGESDMANDQVTMVKDENGNWYVVKLPM